MSELTPREANRRRRVVQGWMYREEGKKVRDQIQRYLNGGPVPPDYREVDRAIGLRRDG